MAATPNAHIQIGSRVDIAPRMTLVVGSHELGSAHRRAGAGKSLPITIGDGTWIGAGALILGGVTIGEGCVIAAGAIVTTDVPANTLAAGGPPDPSNNSDHHSAALVLP